MREGFLRDEYRATVLLDSPADSPLERIWAFLPPVVRRWIDLERS